MKEYHKTHPGLMNESLRTTMLVVGAGGTGSHFVDCMAQLHHALIQIGHPGLHLKLVDDDIVERHNMGRQMFGWGDIGERKSEAIIKKVNREYGLQWESNPGKMDFDDALTPLSNIMVTCVDNGATRNALARNLQLAFRKPEWPPDRYTEHSRTFRPYYWLDIGNGPRYGQYVLGSRTLPTSVEMFGWFDEGHDEGNSCSAHGSLLRQDLYINRTLATHAADLLWSLFRRRGTNNFGGFINLETGIVRPMEVGKFDKQELEQKLKEQANGENSDLAKLHEGDEQGMGAA